MSKVTIQYPNPREVAQAAADWAMLPNAIAQSVAVELVEYARPFTPTDTGALSHPTIKHATSGKVSISYDASTNGVPYAWYVNEGVGWRGKPVKKYTTAGTGPHFLEKMTDSDIVKQTVYSVVENIGELVGGEIFDATRKLGSNGKYTAYNYTRPAIFREQKYNQYFK
ncbi:MAG: hypothetical protein NC218_03485 [Acetobacter sp.]|nr:hypothetical protein [Acetobacter sp.]